MDHFYHGLALFIVLHPVIAMFPFTRVLQVGSSPDRPRMVDIEGSRGRALLELRESYLTLQGKLILRTASRCWTISGTKLCPASR